MDFNSEKIYYNAFNIITDCNYSLLARLKEFYGSFIAAWEASGYDEFLNANKHFALDTIENLMRGKTELDPVKEWDKLKNLGIKMHLIEEDEYPSLLKEIPNAPLAIYQLGDFDQLQSTIAVVGTRKPTNYGKMVAEKITKDLVECGFVIVSGLAYGIDTICHQTTLECGGSTIAVLGSGLDIIFPPTNKRLAQKIMEKQGALISEYAPSLPPLKHHFPARNRIVSGLSLGVVVVEAPLKSGALITARFALDQNREVFAIPGSIFSKNSEGTHQLIKSGAKLVNSITDILEELNMIPEVKIFDSFEDKIAHADLSAEEKKIISIIKEADHPLLVDEIVSLAHLPIDVINQTLTLLELKNFIRAEANGYRLVI
ncbi:MAG TPA: DNA-processing protein DprA [Candidatus Paceibacterota bacterium]|nr:DNA-processing protein DprA [Candidatus Paceibacterota bacterium]